MDIFDELHEELYVSIELPTLHNDERRFSFSIPNPTENMVLATPSVAPPAPPPSPTIMPLERPVILIPDDDFYFELCAEDSLSPPHSPLIDIQTVLDFPKHELYLTAITDENIYKEPPKQSHDARKVWRAAQLPRVSTIREVEIALLNWANTYARLEIKDRKILSITWISESKCTCRSTWAAFIRWMACACYSV